VWWYNGHPDGADLPVKLKGVANVAICGAGNVALDCARILLKPPDSLASSDISSLALRHLKDMGRVQQVGRGSELNEVGACEARIMPGVMTGQPIGRMMTA
jgi:adrenodoxin-NADP+ reductase